MKVVLCLVLVVVEGVATGGAVVVGLAGSSPSWWQKMVAVGSAEVSREGGNRGGRRWSSLLSWFMHFIWL